MKNKLYRCRDNAVFGGVVSGIAEYFQWTLDTSLLRVLLVILALFTNGILIVAYLVAWIIIPKKPLNQLKNILGHIDEDVKVEYNDVNAVFTFESYKLVCRLVEGKYPNYEAVIPKDNPNKLILDRYQLLNSIKRVSIFANQSTNQIRLSISGQELVLSAEDLDYTNEARERLNCNYSGDDMEIGFNSKFFIEMLNNVDTKEVELELSTPSRAGLILPVDSEEEKEEIVMLVMPVMLNS